MVPVVLRVTLLSVLVLAAKNYNIKIRRYTNDKGSACRVINCKLSRINQTMSKLDLRVAVGRNLPNTSMVDIIGNEMINEKYVVNGFAVQKDMPLCGMLEKEKYQNVAQKQPGIPKSCPIRKGNYTIRSYRIDESSMPDSLPVQDNWRVDMAVKNQGKVLCSNHVFLYIDHNVKGG